MPFPLITISFITSANEQELGQAKANKALTAGMPALLPTEGASKTWTHRVLLGGLIIKCPNPLLMIPFVHA